MSVVDILPANTSIEFGGSLCWAKDIGEKRSAALQYALYAMVPPARKRQSRPGALPTQQSPAPEAFMALYWANINRHVVSVCDPHATCRNYSLRSRAICSWSSRRNLSCRANLKIAKVLGLTIPEFFSGAPLTRRSNRERHFYCGSWTSILTPFDPRSLTLDSDETADIERGREVREQTLFERGLCHV